MNTSVPIPLASYYTATNAHDVEKMLACFKDNATVLDEGETLKGARQIEAWMKSTISKYKFSSKIIKVENMNEKTRVTATVSGNFPGSPIDLRYDFTIVDEKIQALQIGV